MDPVNQSPVIQQLIPVIQQLTPLDESLHQRLVQEAFGSEKWKAYSAGTIAKNEDTDKESRSLLDFINKIGEGLSSEKLGEKIETMLNDGLFVRIPKDLTFENIGAVVKSKLPESGDNGYDYFYPPDDQEPVDDSYWVWISRNPIEGSRGKTYSAQKEMAAEHGYQDCRAREVIAGLVAEYSRSGTFLCEDVFARCLDTRNGYQVVVGFGRSGLDASAATMATTALPFWAFRVGGLRKFGLRYLVNWPLARSLFFGPWFLLDRRIAT